MGFRDWPSWLKGGLIITFVYMVIVLSLISLYFKNKDSDASLLLGIITLPGYLSLLILRKSIRLPFIEPEDAIVSILLINFIYVLIVGVIIGWIIGKLKSKNSKLKSEK